MIREHINVGMGSGARAHIGVPRSSVRKNRKGKGETTGLEKEKTLNIKMKPQAQGCLGERERETERGALRIVTLLR